MRKVFHELFTYDNTKCKINNICHYVKQIHVIYNFVRKIFSIFPKRISSVLPKIISENFLAFPYSIHPQPSWQTKIFFSFGGGGGGGGRGPSPMPLLPPK